MSSFHSKICGDVTEVTEVRATRSVFLNPVLFLMDFLPGLRSLEAHEGHTKLLQLHEEAGVLHHEDDGRWLAVFFQQKFHGSSKCQGNSP